MIPIAGLSVAGFALCIDRWFYYYRIKREALKFLRSGLVTPDDDMSAKQPENENNPIIRILNSGILCSSVEDAESVMKETAIEEIPGMERGLSTIAIIGSTLPMLGLLGTVVGMIETFDTIAIHGVGDPTLLSGGISQALITTESGLVMAIPFLFIHNHLVNSFNHLVSLMEKEASRVLKIVKGRISVDERD